MPLQLQASLSHRADANADADADDWGGFWIDLSLGQVSQGRAQSRLRMHPG